jgi:hypothetical protein
MWRKVGIRNLLFTVDDSLVECCSVLSYWSQQAFQWCLHHHSDGGSKHLRNICQLQRPYTAKYSRRLSSSYSLPWGPDISFLVYIYIFNWDLIHRKIFSVCRYVLQIPNGWRDFCIVWQERVAQRTSTRELTGICQSAIPCSLKRVNEDCWMLGFPFCLTNYLLCINICEHKFPRFMIVCSLWSSFTYYCHQYVLDNVT